MHKNITTWRRDILCHQGRREGSLIAFGFSLGDDCVDLGHKQWLDAFLNTESTF